MPKAKGDVLKDPILKRIVEIIVKELEPDKIILFGSRARGDYKEDSDYDILVLKRGIKPEERRRLIGKIEFSLFKAKIYIPTDILVLSESDFIKLSNDVSTVYPVIYREGKVIYEKKTKKWLDFALHDLRWAVIHASLPQQTIEKSLKAVIVSKGIVPPKTHNIKALYGEINKLGIEIPKYIEHAVDLTPYAFTTRYPDDYIPVSKGEYEEAYEIALKVYEWAKGIIESSALE